MKSIIKQTVIYTKYLKVSLVCLLGIALMYSCKKETSKNLNGNNNNSIAAVIADNFNLLMFKTMLGSVKLDQQLKNEGPFTVLAPSDDAFALVGYPNTTSIVTANLSTLSSIGRYHILQGKYEFNKLPFQFNQELRSDGGKLYVTRWVKNSDTVLTINGSRLVAINVPASNGLIQVIDRVLTPYTHDKLVDALASEPSITLFYQAIKTAGLLPNLAGTNVFTVFAPNNDAMKAYGFATLEQIRDTDPEKLKRLVNYHTVQDRRFIYDYVLSTKSTTIKQATLLEGNTINIKLIADNSQVGGFSGVTLLGLANVADLKVVKRDILTGNGVFHIIDGVLKNVQ